jgi:hypothetical protein
MHALAAKRLVHLTARSFSYWPTKNGLGCRRQWHWGTSSSYTSSSSRLFSHPLYDELYQLYRKPCFRGMDLYFIINNLIFIFLLKFVEGLKLVPLTDPSSLVIPPDPFDVFSQMHGLSSLAPYDETFKPTEARLYLKQTMVSQIGISKTERTVWDDDCMLYLSMRCVKNFNLSTCI